MSMMMEKACRVELDKGIYMQLGRLFVVLAL